MTTCERTNGKKKSDFTSRIPGTCWLRKIGYRHPANRSEQKENQPVNVVSKRCPKLLIVKKLLIVGQTNEFLVDSNPIPLKKTEPEGLKDRDHHINGKDDRRRGDKKPRRKIVAAHSTPSFRRDNTRLAGCALRAHVILGD